MSNSRIDYVKVAKTGMNNMFEMEKYINSEFSLEKSLVELIKIRVSQINGCAYCLNMHTAEARKVGETEQRIYLLSAWKETELYTKREKTAFAFAEKLTCISENTISNDFYEATKMEFNDKEFTDLIILVNQINAWNRISISMANQI